jgi:hypothetical protein
MNEKITPKRHGFSLIKNIQVPCSPYGKDQSYYKDVLCNKYSSFKKPLGKLLIDTNRTTKQNVLCVRAVKSKHHSAQIPLLLLSEELMIT